MDDIIRSSLNTICHEKCSGRDNYVTAEKVKNEFLGHSESHETILTLFCVPPASAATTPPAKFMQFFKRIIIIALQTTWHTGGRPAFASYKIRLEKWTGVI